MDAHSTVAEIRRLFNELSRTPTWREYLAAGNTEWSVKKFFGTYTNALAASGLERGQENNAPLEAEYFPQEPLKTHLEAHEPRESKSQKPQKTFLVIGDTHFPFIHKGCMDAIYEFNLVNKPDYIIQVGDLYDLYAHSKFPKSINGYTPQEEERLAREGAVEMWKRLKQDNPGSKCFQINGNHDIRPAKRVLELAPGFEHVIKKHYAEMMRFDGVETIEDYRQELILEGIMFHHGYRSKLGDHRDFVRQNFVCGHSHKGGVVFRKMAGETIWELNAGFVGDADSKALSYTAQKINDQTLGWGFIDQHGPRFIYY